MTHNTNEITFKKFASHCEIYINNKFYISCDHNELNDELKELEDKRDLS